MKVCTMGWFQDGHAYWAVTCIGEDELSSNNEQNMQVGQKGAKTSNAPTHGYSRYIPQGRSGLFIFWE